MNGFGKRSGTIRNALFLGCYSLLHFLGRRLGVIMRGNMYANNEDKDPGIGTYSSAFLKLRWYHL